MFSYDSTTRILKVQKVEEQPIDLSLLEHQQASYQRYLEQTLFEDLDYLLQSLRDKLQVSELKGEFRVLPPYTAGYKSDIKRQSPSYIPVVAKFVIDGMQFPAHAGSSGEDWIELLRIPYMDASGVLNINGGRRVISMQLKAAEHLSYDDAKHRISVTLPRRNISISIDGQGDIRIKHNGTNVDFHRVVCAYNMSVGAYENPTDVFASAFILAAFASDKKASTPLAISKPVIDLGVLKAYASPEYALGRTRGALNEALSLKRALGRTLSRPVGSYEAGMRVDAELLRYAHTHAINTLYVEALPDIVGYKLIYGVALNHIPAGTTNNELLRAFLPQYADYSVIPRDCQSIIWLPVDKALTPELILLLKECKVGCVYCRKGTGAEIEAHFEEEVLGNFTAILGDIYGSNIPEGRAYDEWVYLYNNPTYEALDNDHLNCHDMMALYSLCAFIRKNPEENFLLDKDAGLLKRVCAANELFSETLRDSVTQFVQRYKRSISIGITQGALEQRHFYGLTVMWLRSLREKNYLALADTTNPVATLSQLNHLEAGLRSKKVPVKMRLLSMGYYGRICPYETPSGQKLGIVNTRAIGSIVEEGILKTPYRRVLKDSTGAVTGISSTPVYMDVQEEAVYRIGDLLSLTKDATGKYINTKVMARIPAPNNQVTVESVDLYSLDYVNAHSEQHLSLTSAMIPFACADDAVRVTYATNMLKQSILLQNSEAPRVITSAYTTCFSQNPDYVLYARADGRVDEIRPGKLLLTYTTQAGEDEEDIILQETLILDKSINFLNFHVREGESFKKGDLLVDSAAVKHGIYAPGTNLLVAYLANGYNYEDAISISATAADKLTSVEVETVTRRVQRRDHTSVRIGRDHYFQYIPEHGVLGNLSSQDMRDQRQCYIEPMRSGRHAGLLLQIERNLQETKCAEYRAHLLAWNRARTGDKLAGRHSNKGTVSIVQEDSLMPCFANGQPVEVLLNQCGVPSRMNIGQLFEAYLGFIATLLDIYVESNAFNGATRDDIKLLMRYVWELANSPNPDEVFRKFPMLPMSLHDQARHRHSAIRDWEGCFTPDGMAQLWDPATGKYLASPVTFGVAHILKLEHQVSHKLHARSGPLEEDYSQITKQPTEGAAHGGGQRMGEMELCALAAYGAKKFLHETCNGTSDNVRARGNTLIDALGLEEPPYSSDDLPHSVEMFKYYLEALGLRVEENEGIYPADSLDAAAERVLPDIRHMLANQSNVVQPVTDVSSLFTTLMEVYK